MRLLFGVIIRSDATVIRVVIQLAGMLCGLGGCSGSGAGHAFLSCLPKPGRLDQIILFFGAADDTILVQDGDYRGELAECAGAVGKAQLFTGPAFPRGSHNPKNTETEQFFVVLRRAFSFDFSDANALLPSCLQK